MQNSKCKIQNAKFKIKERFALNIYNAKCEMRSAK